MCIKFARYVVLLVVLAQGGRHSGLVHAQWDREHLRKLRKALGTSADTRPVVPDIRSCRAMIRRRPSEAKLLYASCHLHCCIYSPIRIHRAAAGVAPF